MYACQQNKRLIDEHMIRYVITHEMLGVCVMINHFVSPTYRDRFLYMVAEDGMFPGDSERASLFYLLTGNDDLYRKRRFIYDSAEHCICICFENLSVDLSSGAGALVRLGFNLYNGWSDRYTTPLSILGSLDSRNLLLAGNAITIRFNRSFLEDLVGEQSHCWG